MQVLSNALRVLECVVVHQPVGVSEVARQLDLPKSSVQRALTALEDEGWLTRDDRHGGLWVQTARIWVLAHQGREIGVHALAQEPMRKLWEQTNENIHFTQRQGTDLVVVDKIESTHSVRVYDPIGTGIPLHVSASGKAILATRSDAAIDAYLDGVLAGFTGQSLTDPDALRRELAEIRQRGFAINRGEWRDDIRGVGIALPAAPGEESEFGLAVSMPAYRMDFDKLDHYAAILTEARDAFAAAMRLEQPQGSSSRRVGGRASGKLRIGLVVPPSDGRIPPEAAAFADRAEFISVGLGIAEMAPDDFDAGLERLDDAVAQLVASKVDAITVLGTSLSFYRGAAAERALRERLQAAAGDIPTTTLSASVSARLREHSARSVGVISAYSDDMAQRLTRFLTDDGFSVTAAVNLGITTIAELEAVGSDVLDEAARRVLADGPRPDALLISCGGLRTADVNAAISERTGIPVVSSAVDGLAHIVALAEAAAQR